MSRSRCLTLLAAVGLAAAIGVAPGLADSPATGTPGMAVVGSAVLVPVDDPFPIARVRVTEAQLPEAIKPFDSGVLVRMPRDDFEARVRAAALAATSARTVPRLLKAEYKATLVGGDLTGTAEWTILNPSPRPAAFPLDPLRLAIGSPTWADGREAIVGVLGAGFPAPGPDGPAGGAGISTRPVVWVEGTGRQVLKFKWSLAGTAAPGERQFDLRVPPCPTTVLDLELPAGRVPTVASLDVLLTGPTSTADPKRQVWRLRPGDRPRLAFAVRSPGEATPTGAVLASLAASYDLSTGQVACSFDYDLQSARGSVGEWVFQLDPGLQVTDVVMTNRASWRWTRRRGNCG